MVSKEDPDSNLDACSDAWKVFVKSVLEHTLSDGDFPKDTDECVKIFGEQKGPMFSSKQRPFWPVVINEGELMDDDRQPMPVVKQVVVSQGSVGEVYKCTLAKGAIRSTKGMSTNALNPSSCSQQVRCHGTRLAYARCCQPSLGRQSKICLSWKTLRAPRRLLSHAKLASMP